MSWTDCNDRLAQAASYIRGRQCRNGGFCFYRNDYLEEPNLGDTWHALAALKLLAVDVPRLNEVVLWLDGFAPASLNLDGLHDWAFSRRLLLPTWAPDQGTCAQIAELPLLPPNQDENLSGFIERLIRIVELKAAFTDVESAPGVIAWLQKFHRGGYGYKPNLQETALALKLLAGLGEPDETDETKHFVDSLQSPQLGFDNTVDSRYCRLDILLAGVRCCTRLGLPVKYSDIITSIAFGAQRRDGAFADVPGALPTLESHHAALELLDMLRMIDRPASPVARVK